MESRTLTRIGAGILVAVFLFSSLPAGVAEAADSALEEATVNLYCRIKLSGSTISITGSGVFIDPRGVILTNAHVAQYFLLEESGSKTKTTCTIRTGSPAKDAYTASVLFISPQWARAYASAVDDKKTGKGTGEFDFALLYVDGMKKKKAKMPETFPALPLSSVEQADSAYEGAPIQIAGYPAEDLDFKEIQKKLKRVVADSSLDGFRTFLYPNIDVLLLSPSKAGRSGVSGGPVLTENDEVIGIATTMGNENGDDRSLRGITTSYIERVVRMDTGLALPLILSGDYGVRNFLTFLLLPENTVENIETELRRLK